MSAPNQIQSNNIQYYLDQYVVHNAVFAGNSSPGDNFTTNLRFRKLGNQVIVTVQEVTANAGTTVGLTRYNTDIPIPELYRPTHGSAIGFVVCINPTNISQTCYIIVAPTGQLFLYPTGALFTAGSSIYGGTFQYFL